MFRSMSKNKEAPFGKQINERCLNERASKYNKINTDNEFIGATSTLQATFVKHERPERARKCEPPKA